MRLGHRFLAAALCAMLAAPLLCCAAGCKSEASARGGSTKEGPAIQTGVPVCELPGQPKGGEGK